MENSIIQELNTEVDRITGNKLLPAKSRQRYEEVYKLFIECQNEKKCLVTKFVHETFEVRFATVGGLRSPASPPGLHSWTPRGLRPGPTRDPPPVLPSPPYLSSACHQLLQSLKSPISMSSSGKIAYASWGESGHANSRQVRSTWPKVIATERYLAITFDLVRRTSRSSAFHHFRVSTRNVLLLCNQYYNFYTRLTADADANAVYVRPCDRQVGRPRCRTSESL